jgi:hypothetical protein
MKLVLVRGADGERKALAFVRRAANFVYVCAEARYAEVLSGNEDPVVGFPAEDVEDLQGETRRSKERSRAVRGNSHQSPR